MPRIQLASGVTSHLLTRSSRRSANYETESIRTQSFGVAVRTPRWLSVLAEATNSGDVSGWRQLRAWSRVVESRRARLAFVLISTLYRQMYANTGVATDSARVQRSARWARWMGHVCRRLFMGKPMLDSAVPGPTLEPAID